MPRRINTFRDQPLEHVLEVEIVDYDSQSIRYLVQGHDDPALVSLTIYRGEQSITWTRSRDAIKAMLEAVLADVDRVQPIPKLDRSF